jgi:site-specific DNA-cytosine methylase
MSETGNALYNLMPDITPKIDASGVAFSLRSRDNKDPQIVCYRKQGHPQTSDGGQGWEETEVNDTLSTFDTGETRTPTLVVENKAGVFEVEMEVEKRKYKVDTAALIKCLHEHKTISISEIAEALNKPKTTVEHWFRKDSSFSIPDADAWITLKELLGIKTDEFDESIMTFETDGSSYDMRNRIHAGTIAPTFTASSENNLHLIENHPADSRVKFSESGVVQTLSSRMGTGGGNTPMILNDQGGCQMSVSEKVTGTLRAQEHGHQPCVQNERVVRRLTPLECERLQGYPDGWTDIGEWMDTKGKKHKEADSPRYKALGNSIALPFWEWMAKRMVLYIDGEPTMASLFDGIGGFPLVFTRAGCKPIWASEIEEFPIAVTKIRFPEGGEE